MNGTDTVADQPGGAVSSRDQRPVAVVVAIALVVVVAALLGIVLHRLSAQNHRQHAEATAAYLAGPNAQAAEAAASREATATLTYNYKTLPADFAAAEAGMTPHFRSSYLKSTQTLVTPTAPKTQADSTAAVTAGGVSQATETTATVLLFVDQTVTNNLLAHPRLDRSRVEVSMVKLNGKWLINNLVPL